MQILPVKATPTWAGVRVPDGNGGGGTAIVPWEDALDSRSVTRRGERLRVEYQFGRGDRLAEAYRRRSLRNTLRSGGTVRWTNPNVPGPVAERLETVFLAFLTIVGLGLMFQILLTPIIKNGPGSIGQDLPLGVALAMWAVWLIFFVTPILFAIVFIPLVATRSRWMTKSVEMSRDRLVIHCRDRTATIDAGTVESLTNTLGDRVLTTTTGDRVRLRDIPRSLLNPWLNMHASDVVARHEEAQVRSTRTAAVTLLIGSLAMVLLIALVDPPGEHPSPLVALVMVPIFPAVLWWASRQSSSHRVRRRRRTLRS